MSHGKALLPGLLLVAVIVGVAHALAGIESVRAYGIGPLVLAIAVGAALGNLSRRFSSPRLHAGLAFSQSRLLRIGVALYGFNLSVQQILLVGKAGIVVDLLTVTTTLAVGWFVGTRCLKMESDTALLTAAGSAICGAAAVVATAPILCRDERLAEKSAVAVATVVLFGTLAMFLYPFLYHWLGPDFVDFGTYVGSTVHEVAQVVAVGNALGESVAGNAVIVKMIRVMLLVPFLLLLGAVVTRRSARDGVRQPIAVPWFAFAFLGVVVINSLHVVPPQAVHLLQDVGLLFLAAAMAALGLGTTLARMRTAGPAAVLLGACLFLHLIVVGGLINRLLS